MSVKIESQAEPIPGYKLLDRLGSGGFGEVWRAEAPGGIFKAIKIIHGDLRSRDNDLVRYAEQELKALKRVKMVRHPYLLALDRYDIVDGRLMITMELADCNLWDRFREHKDKGRPGIPRDELLMYMAESAEVLDLMNDQFQLQHLDIKPQNLFLVCNHVKVADFGQVKDLQGVMASVTGGITPVYAAPETFDGLVSRFCDQYSLACVYQELLTGQRPFDGGSMSQLLMQHLQLPPNLGPSPAHDRPALLRALAKRPEDRWPSVSAFVRALRDGGSGTVARSGTVSVAADRPPADDQMTPPSGLPLSNPSVDTPVPRGGQETVAPVFTPAPPEVSGDGPLRPTLVVGIGQTGLRVLQRFRHDLEDRYGSARQVPLVRTLYVDTDPDAIDDAAVARPAERLARLGGDDVYAARLNRSGHYLKPRLNGRSLTDGWFDPQLLYRIPRTPQTMGLRLLGRLAFCDHFRPLLGKVQAELDAALNPESLYVTEHRTGLARRTNRPLVYVVAGLGGGTGGGMFLDMAYAVKSRLRRMGYDRPEVVGLFLLPPADAGQSPPQVLGNTYAALTELNHFSRPDTLFSANYDDRNGAVREKEPPFARVYLLPGPVGTANPGQAVSASPPPGRGSGSVGAPRPRLGDSGPRPAAAYVRPDPAAALRPIADAAELLRLNLFSPVGRVADEARRARAADAPAGVTVAAFGVTSFDWPRAEVVARTADKLARAVAAAWASPNLKRCREVVPAWAAERWAGLGLDPDAVLGRLQKAAEGAVGGRVEELLSLTTEPLVPKGWLSRLPDPARVAVGLDKINKLFGPPVPGKRPPTPAEEAVAQAAAGAAAGFVEALHPVLPALAEDPQFRLAGAEEAARQFLATTDRLLEKYAADLAGLDGRAIAGYECVVSHAHSEKGVRRPTAAEFGEAIRQFPRARFQAVVVRQLVETYRAVRDALSAQLAELAAVRQRVEASAAARKPDAADEPAAANPRRLMPAGCESVADAVARFAAVLTDADRDELDRRLQAVLEAEAGGLLAAVTTTQAGAAGVVHLLFEEARAYLDARLGAVDLAAMFADRYRTPQGAELAISRAYTDAEPGWVGNGPWAAGEVVVLGGPAAGPLREIAGRGIPVAGLPTADAADELTVYREYPGVPLAALPHLGPAAAAAYQTQPDATQCSPHARLDVTQWVDVDTY